MRITVQTYYPRTDLDLVGTKLWADTFIRGDGAPGNTEQGALPWVTTAAAGCAFGIIGGRLVVTAAVSGAGFCTVTPPTPRSLLVAQIPVQEGTSAPGGIVFRFGDADNHLVLARVSPSDKRWRRVKRLAAVTSQVAILGQAIPGCSAP